MAHTMHPAFAAFLVLLAPACIHVDDDDVYYDPYVEEVEPNDFHWTAQHLGTLGVGETILLRGHVTDTGFDRFDGFAFRSEQPMDVQFELTADAPFVDLDLALFDPYTTTTVASWESGVNPEFGEFSVHSTAFEFHLVVNSFHGSGTYVLAVRGKPLGWGGDGPEALGAPRAAGEAVFGAQTALEARRTTTRAGAAADWSGYSAQHVGVPDEAVKPTVRMWTVVLDPATGQVLARADYRLPAALLRPRED